MSARLLASIRFCLILVCAQFALTIVAQAQVSVTFQGHVKYSNGEPVVGATVTMTIRHNLSFVGTETTTTNGAGNYTFQSSRSNPPCTPNEWSFQAFIAQVVDDEALPPSQTASSSGCAGPGVIGLGDLIIVRPNPITLGGIVRDGRGVPVQGLTITMTRTKYNLNPPVTTTATTITDGNGHYQFNAYSRCSIDYDFRASIRGVTLQGGTATGGCVLASNDFKDFPVGLGIQDNAGHMGCNGSVGRPVNVTTGNVYLQQTDFQLPSTIGGLSLTRFYNSLTQHIGLFGRGWTTDFDERVVTNANNQLQLTLPDGRLVSFATPDFFGQIIKNANGTYTVTFKDGRVHQFDVAGRLLSMTDLNGNQTLLAYDGAGRLTTITDPFARVLTVTTNSNGRVLSITDSLGTVATYTYNSDRLLSVTYADNSAFHFAYTPITGGLGLTSITDALGNIIEQHDYDAQGRATSSQAHGGVERYTLNYVSATQTDVTDALNHLTKYFFHRVQGRNVVHRVEGLCGCGGSQVQTWAYNDQANVTSKTDALNHVTSYTYDSAGNVLTETDATGTVTYTYNSLGDVLTRTNQMNGVTTNTYDAQGKLLTTTDALNKTTTFTYDSRGQMLTATDARGKVTSFTYDGLGNRTRRTDANSIITFFFYDARRRLTKVRDGLSRSTLFAYDAAGRVNRVTHPDLSFITITFDLAGRRTRITDERGNQTNYTFDNAYRLTSVTDAANQVTTYASDLMSNLTSVTDSLSRVTTYEYDDFNRLKKIIYPPGETGTTSLFETITYDANGNVTSITDTAGRTTTNAYDNVNRRTSTTDAANKTTTFQYDNLSRVTTLTDAVNQQYQFGYDALGRTTQVTRGGSSLSHVYDEVGNRIQRTDYNGVVTNYSYDNLNRLTTISYPARSVTYAYDPLHNLTRTTNENGSVYISYDNRYRVSSVSDPFFYGISYNYDTAGNRTKLKVNGATYATYVYDSVNRLTSLIDSANLNFTYNYDAANRLTSHTAPNGVTTSRTYDGLNRLTSLLHTAGATTLSGNLYGYNDANNISSWATAATQKAFTYDAVDRLTATTDFANPVENYVYDGVGNRTASHLSASYSYEPFNKLTSTAIANYSYDNNGNLVSKTDSAGTTTFAFNEENQLTQVGLPSGLTVNYRYDGLGRRIQRTTSAGANERYIYDGDDVLIDLNADWSVATTYLNNPGIDNHLRQTNTSTGVSYFLNDHLGSTAALTDASGNVVEQVAYDAFGNNTGSARTRYTYTGRESDPDTGMFYYRARFYDPQNGRFISEDPIGLAGGINKYSYVGNNSLNGQDPLGRYEKDVHFYLTYYLALQTGCFSESEARQIAHGNQDVDLDSNTRPDLGVSVGRAKPDYRQQQVNIDYHALHDGSHQPYLNMHWKKAVGWAGSGGNLRKLGVYLHYLQDTYSHSGYSDPSWGHSPPHRGATHAEDKTDENVEKAMEMARATYDALVRFAKETGRMCKCTAGPDWNKVRRFAEAPGGNFYTRRVYSIEEIDPWYLNNKIKILEVDP